MNKNISFTGSVFVIGNENAYKLLINYCQNDNENHSIFNSNLYHKIEVNFEFVNLNEINQKISSDALGLLLIYSLENENSVEELEICKESLMELFKRYPESFPLRVMIGTTYRSISCPILQEIRQSLMFSWYELCFEPELNIDHFFSSFNKELQFFVQSLIEQKPVFFYSKDNTPSSVENTHVFSYNEFLENLDKRTEDEDVFRSSLDILHELSNFVTIHHSQIDHCESTKELFGEQIANRWNDQEIDRRSIIQQHDERKSDLEYNSKIYSSRHPGLIDEDERRQYENIISSEEEEMKLMSTSDSGEIIKEADPFVQHILEGENEFEHSEELSVHETEVFDDVSSSQKVNPKELIPVNEEPQKSSETVFAKQQEESFEDKNNSFTRIVQNDLITKLEEEIQAKTKVVNRLEVPFVNSSFMMCHNIENMPTSKTESKITLQKENEEQHESDVMESDFQELKATKKVKPAMELVQEPSEKRQTVKHDAPVGLSTIIEPHVQSIEQARLFRKPISADPNREDLHSSETNRKQQTLFPYSIKVSHEGFEQVIEVKKSDSAQSIANEFCKFCGVKAFSAQYDDIVWQVQQKMTKEELKNIK